MFASRARITMAGTGIAVALLIAGCSGSSGGSGTTSTPMANMPGMSHSTATSAPTRADFDDADVMFLQMMYPHHAQAVEMAKLVPSRSQNQQLITLAANIEKAQAPEMAQFADLLRSFGKPAPSAAMDHAMDGMMSQNQMTALRNASGAAFDKMWLQMMIEHHKGAITMSNTELANGTNAEVKTLARGIVTAQQAEIQQMQGMLTQS